VPSYFDAQPPLRMVPAEWTWPQWRVPETETAGSSSRQTAQVNPLFLRGSRQEPVAFLRAFDLPFEAAAAALHSWWQQDARSGTLDVGRSHLLGPPNLRQSGRCQMEVHLGRGFARRALTMDFELVPWYESFGTIVSLCPRSRVRPGQRYFRTGHALIDGVIAAVGRRAANQ
jgi:hypothetical protein